MSFTYTYKSLNFIVVKDAPRKINQEKEKRQTRAKKVKENKSKIKKN